MNITILVISILYLTLYELYYKIKFQKAELNNTQKYLLKFIDPKRVISILKSKKSIKSSEIKALEIFLKLEKEGDINKQLALLTYLSNKHQSKSKKKKAFIIGIIIFIITTLFSLIIQDYAYIPIKEFLKTYIGQ